ncbi:MAG: hypothetical protein K6D02_06995 [Lachnospiraceae bacterium]|nr:hypothetical protein [Lachnospiraceae bacterium]
MIIDIDKLRDDMMDEYGTAMGNFPMATMDLVEVENASPEELVDMAMNEGIDLRKYEV